MKKISKSAIMFLFLLTACQGNVPGIEPEKNINTIPSTALKQNNADTELTTNVLKKGESVSANSVKENTGSFAEKTEIILPAKKENSLRKNIKIKFNSASQSPFTTKANNELYVKAIVDRLNTKDHQEIPLTIINRAFSFTITADLGDQLKLRIEAKNAAGTLVQEGEKDFTVNSDTNEIEIPMNNIVNPKIENTFTGTFPEPPKTDPSIGPLPSPNPTPLQTPGSTPAPTEIPSQVQPPIPTSIPIPQPTSLPLPSLEPTPIPTPIPTPFSTSTPMPTPVPTPIMTAIPTPTPIPSPVLIIDDKSSVITLDNSQFTHLSPIQNQVSLNNDGKFVLTFSADTNSIFAKKFDINGNSLSNKINVTTGNSAYPSVAMNENGNFVVSWLYTDNQSIYTRKVYAKRFDSLGTALEDKIIVQDVKTGGNNYLDDPAVGIDQQGNFIVAWRLYLSSTNDMDVYFKKYLSTGLPAGNEVLGTTTTKHWQKSPVVSMNSKGNFALIWENSYQSGGYMDIDTKMFDNNGNVFHNEELLSTPSSNIANKFPFISLNNNNEYVAVWMSTVINSKTGNVFATKYGNGKFSTVLKVEEQSNLSDFAIVPRVALNNKGQFVVIWAAKTSTNSSLETTLFAQFYDSNNNLIGSKIKVSNMDEINGSPSVGLNDNGDCIIVWAQNNAIKGKVFKIKN